MTGPFRIILSLWGVSVCGGRVGKVLCIMYPLMLLISDLLGFRGSYCNEQIIYLMPRQESPGIVKLCQMKTMKQRNHVHVDSKLHGGVIVWVLSVLTLCEVNIERAVKVRIALGKVN